MAKSRFWLCVTILITAIGCSTGDNGPTAPTAAPKETRSVLQTLVAHAAADPSGAAMERALAAVFGGGTSHGLAVTFPPRNEPVQFRAALEDKYRDSLRRSPVATYVDQEGTVVWTQEYLRYRVSLCSHADATAKVMSQIDGRGIAAECGTASTATFPPRNEPLAFMQDLETKYRDSIRRPAGSSFVDVEGNVIWTQEYLRYRVSTCSHSVAQQKVFDQIDGRGVAADCTPVVTVTPTPTPSGLSCGAPAVVTCINGGQQGTPTARCDDGAWSCSTTASGTCSSHGGISCRVCPGPLCTTGTTPTPTPNPTPTPTPTPNPGPATRIGATCNDGTSSTAIGSGACSSHGGVRCWRYSDGSCRAS
jgi:hypothetical protein